MLEVRRDTYHFWLYKIRFFFFFFSSFHKCNQFQVLDVLLVQTFKEVLQCVGINNVGLLKHFRTHPINVQLGTAIADVMHLVLLKCRIKNPDLFYSRWLKVKRMKNPDWVKSLQGLMRKKCFNLETVPEVQSYLWHKWILGPYSSPSFCPVCCPDNVHSQYLTQPCNYSFQ